MLKSVETNTPKCRNALQSVSMVNRHSSVNEYLVIGLTISTVTSPVYHQVLIYSWVDWSAAEWTVSSPVALTLEFLRNQIPCKVQTHNAVVRSPKIVVWTTTSPEWPEYRICPYTSTWPIDGHAPAAKNTSLQIHTKCLIKYKKIIQKY